MVSGMPLALTQEDVLMLEDIFTARIQRMGEGNIFSLSVSSHLDCGGTNVGVPHPTTGRGGTPSQVQDGRGTPSQVQDGGSAIPGQDGVAPINKIWVPPTRNGCGYLPVSRMGVPPIITGWGTSYWDWMEVAALGLDGGTPPVGTG